MADSNSHPSTNALPAMDAIDLMILNKSLVAAAAGAAPSITQLYNLIVELQDRRDPLIQLYAELGEFGRVLETLRMSLDGSLSRVTKNEQEMLQECRQLLQDCKIVCDELFAKLSAWARDDIQHGLIAVSDAAVKLHIWKMRLDPMAIVMQFNPDGTDLAKADEVGKAIESVQWDISTELRQVNCQLRSFSQGMDHDEETDPAAWDIFQKILLPSKIRQAALLKSIRVCETVAEVLKEKQTPEIAEYITVENRCDFSPLGQTAARGHWVRHSGSISTAKYD